jgi:hypothetical protein
MTYSLVRAYDPVVVLHMWVRERGKTICVEDRPDVCPRRHEVVQRPGWGACPGCGVMLRIWACSECWAVSVDFDHRCGAR